MVSQYEYTQIMNEIQYNYDSREWHLPARFFAEFESDATLIFSTKYAASHFVYNRLAKGA